MIAPLALFEDTEDKRINLEAVLYMWYMTKKACMYLTEEYWSLSTLSRKNPSSPRPSILFCASTYFIHKAVL